MKIKITKPIEIEVVAIRCEMAVRYEEEQIPNDFPGRKGDSITLTLDLETRKVRNWPGGVREIHIKVCDEGSYYLIDAEGNDVGKRESNYVPDCVPGEYGDYFIAAISNDGTIEGWEPTAIQIADCFDFGGDE